ncbi:MAG: diguanylate cyclase domain-containing protein [Bryobacteraceae bacterium]
MCRRVLASQVHALLTPMGFVTVGASQMLWLASQKFAPGLAQLTRTASLVLLLAGFLVVLLIPVLLVADLRRASRIIRQATRQAIAGELLVPADSGQSVGLKPLPPAYLGWSRSLRELAGLFQEYGELFGKLIDRMPVGVALLDSQTKVLSENRRFRRMFGIEGGSLRGRRIQDVLPPCFREQWSPRCLFALNWYGEETSEVRDPVSGRLFRVSLARLADGGQMKGLTALVVEDYIEQAEVQAGTEEFHLLYKGMLEGIPEPLVVVGVDGTVKEMNSMASGLLGYDRDEARGFTLLQLLAAAPDGSANRRLDAYFLSGDWKLQGSIVEASFRRKDGSEFLAEVKLGEWNQAKDRLFVLRLRGILEEKQQGLLTRETLEALEMMSLCQPPEMVLPRLARLVEHQLPGSVCILMVRRANRLFPASDADVPADLLRSMEGLEMNTNEAPCVVAASEARIVVAPDISQSPMREDIRNAVLDHGLRACWSAPMFSREGLVAGAITVYRREDGGPDRWQIRVLESACHLASLSFEQQRIEGELAYRAQHDPVTGLPNRRPFEDRLRLAVAGAKRHGRRFGVMSMVLDGFPNGNGAVPSQTEDELLQELASRLRGSLRETDIVARWGGDEFRFGLLELKDRRDAETVAGRLLGVLKQPVKIDGRNITPNASVGLSLYPDDGQDAAALLLSADDARYSAKRRQPIG